MLKKILDVLWDVIQLVDNATELAEFYDLYIPLPFGPVIYIKKLGVPWDFRIDSSKVWALSFPVLSDYVGEDLYIPLNHAQGALLKLLEIPWPGSENWLYLDEDTDTVLPGHECSPQRFSSTFTIAESMLSMYIVFKIIKWFISCNMTKTAISFFMNWYYRFNALMKHRELLDEFDKLMAAGVLDQAALLTAITTLNGKLQRLSDAIGLRLSFL